jgi:hypothetical protein
MLHDVLRVKTKKRASSKEMVHTVWHFYGEVELRRSNNLGSELQVLY